jgi:hypothetical protein
MSVAFATARRRLSLGLASATLGLLCSLPAAAAVVGSGTSVTETRPTGAFQAIALRGSIDLEVRQGDTISVQVQGDDNLLPFLETVVEPGASGPVLQVRWKSGQSLTTRSKTKVSIVMPTLSAIAGAGSGDIHVESFSTPSLKLSLAGSGDARLAGLQTEELSLSIAGNADVKGSGRATRLGITISGSGDVAFGELRADEVSVRIAGSGDAEVQAQKSLSVNIAGSGDVVYRGDAALKSSVAGSGTIRRK